MENGKKRLAVLVGCNYPNTRNELHGCINDVSSMKDVLVNKLGFEPSNIELLTDPPGSSIMPTGMNIKAMLNQKWLIALSQEMYYSFITVDTEREFLHIMVLNRMKPLFLLISTLLQMWIFDNLSTVYQ